jgi:presenilin-like A22 family membrane protease
MYFYLPKGKAVIGEIIGESPPQYSLFPILAYFFSVVVVVGVVLFFIPISKLQLFLRIMFAGFYTWGIFVLLSGLIPPPFRVAGGLIIGLAVGVLWFFLPLIWLQDLLLVVTLVGVAFVFGAMIPAWTVVWVLIAISVYDIVAVSLGYMMWMARKLSEADSLPAFIFPRRLGAWRLNLRGASVNKLFKEEAAERDFSLLGGGDIGFPLLLVSSVFFGYGLNNALIVAAAAFVGIVLAYLIQIYVLKGKPLPALPPISFVAIIGFLIVRYIL